MTDQPALDRRARQHNAAGLAWVDAYAIARAELLADHPAEDC